MNKNRHFFYALTLFAVLFTLFFLRRYLTLIGAAAITVMIFNPVYHRLVKTCRGKKGIATAITVLIALLSVVIPLTIVTILGYNQIINVLNDINKTFSGNNSTFDEFLTGAVDAINRTLERISLIEYRLTVEKVQEFLSGQIGPVSRFSVNFLTGLSSTTVSFFTNTIVYLIVLASLFPNQERIIAFLKKLSPLEDHIDELYLKKTRLMAKAMVKGTFVIAFVQGILGGIFLNIAGVPYTFFFIVLFTFLSIIPLGGGIISIPIGIILLLTGNIWQGVFILATHFIVITNVDNFLRPKLVHEDAKLPEALTLLSVFAGISMFGLLGFIFGPVVMILLFTTLEIYIKHYAPKIQAAYKESD